MAIQLLNESERYLLENWADARLLEEAMDRVRTKYKGIFQRVVDVVTEVHPELDAHRVILTRGAWNDGEVGFGRNSWPSDSHGSPAGLWVCSLRLKVLTEADSDHPFAYIWAPKSSNLDIEAARTVVNDAAKGILTPEEWKRAGSGDYLLWWHVLLLC